jgi:two-component system, NtrC family, sensor kinase
MTEVKVVVLDDEPGIVALCERILKASSFLVKAFTEPLLALDHVKENPVELLIVDIRMPQMSGFDVIAESQKLHPDLAVLVMTGYGTIETAIQALRQGVDGLLLKPFEKQEFLSAVQQALADNQRKKDSARVNALRPLFDVSEAMLSETRLEFLLPIIVDAASRLLHCPHVAIYRADSLDAPLDLIFSRGTVPLTRDVPGNFDLVSQSERMKQPILTTLSSSSYGAAMVVPVLRDNLRIVFFVARDFNSSPFLDADLEMFQILARQASVGLENARLYLDLRDYIKRIEQSQAALIQAEKLASTGRMTASIAHEINNPLQAVQNCLHLAARPDIPDDMRQKYFEMTQSELDRLMSTVQRMLDFYRPNVAKNKVNLIDVLETVLQLLSAQLQERHIRVTTSWPSDIPEVTVVGSQIQQVFINLVLNAYDAMPGGGELIISLLQNNDQLEVYFQDTGPGVAVEIRDTLFEPFSSTKEKGSGLGLSVSYGIITAHGGDLEYLQDRGPGACFCVRLPVVE